MHSKDQGMGNKVDLEIINNDNTFDSFTNTIMC